MPSNPRSIRKLDAQGLFQYALNLLGGRAMSAGEVRTKLTRKASEPGDVEQVLARLREYKYIDDSRFAENYATTRKDSGSFGKMRVLRDLRQRRVSGTVAQKAVDQAYEEVDEVTLIEQWLERKFRNVRLQEYLKDEKHLASAYRKLRYAGFSPGATIRVLKRFAERAEELADGEDSGVGEA